jgi:hypothetical protein
MLKVYLLPGLITFAGIAHTQGLSTEAWQAVPDARGIQVVNVECGADFIDPLEIVVRANIPVELSVRTSEPSYEFVSGFGANLPIGKKPNPHRFTPTAQGHFPLLCQQQGTSGGGNPRKKGLLTVVPGPGRK